MAERETIEQRKLQDLAVIQKEKELAIARAELDIQKANASAARFQADAIAAKGRAEAEVLAAKYKAKAQNKEIFLAETQRDMATLRLLQPEGLQGRDAAERHRRRGRRRRRRRGQDAVESRRDHELLGARPDGEGGEEQGSGVRRGGSQGSAVKVPRMFYV